VVVALAEDAGGTARIPCRARLNYFAGVASGSPLRTT
jgi:hypothetical protein